MIIELVTKLKESNADSVNMRIALWDRVSKKDKQYKYARLDVAKDKKQPTQVPPPPKIEEPHSVDILDDDIPF